MWPRSALRRRFLFPWTTPTVLSSLLTASAFWSRDSAAVRAPTGPIWPFWTPEPIKRSRAWPSAAVPPASSSSRTVHAPTWRSAPETKWWPSISGNSKSSARSPQAGIPTAWPGLPANRPPILLSHQLAAFSERQEILRTLYRFLQPSQQLLQVFVPRHEVYLRSIDYQQIGRFIVEKEMLVSPGNLLDIFRRNLVLVLYRFFGDSRAQHLGLGLQIDDQVGRGEFPRQQFVIPFVQLQFFVAEIQVGEDAVLLHQEIGQQWRRGSGGQSFAQALLALHQEIHL